MSDNWWHWIARIVFWTAITLAAVIGYFSRSEAHEIPPAAAQYRATLTREARFYWGIKVPVSIFAGQIHRESGWRSGVCSTFACGLTQFTPGTARDIARIHAADLPGPPTVIDPHWAIRAMVLYDRDLYRRFPYVENGNRWGFTLASYNAGYGWVYKERALANHMEKDGAQWIWVVENVCLRSKAACRETRDYVRSILLHLEPIYRAAGW